MRIRWSRVVMMSVVTLLVGGSASATFVTDGDLAITGSWTQGFIESGVGPFDTMRFDWVSGSLFEPTVITNLPAGWITTANGTHTAGVTRFSPVTSTTFSLHFQGLPATPLVLTGTAYLGTTVLEYARFNWSGSGWSFTPLSNSLAPVPAPEPFSMVMLGCLGAGMLGARKLRGKK